MLPGGSDGRPRRRPRAARVARRLEEAVGDIHDLLVQLDRVGVELREVTPEALRPRAAAQPDKERTLASGDARARARSSPGTRTASCTARSGSSRSGTSCRSGGSATRVLDDGDRVVRALLAEEDVEPLRLEVRLLVHVAAAEPVDRRVVRGGSGRAVPSAPARARSTARPPLQRPRDPTPKMGSERAAATSAVPARRGSSCASSWFRRTPG